MERRARKELGVAPSLLGFGCMRFPTLEGGAIDEDKALAMLDRAYRGGVNYYDTAYFYHNGKSEEFMGRALARYPRESYYLTSKLPTTLVHSLEDAKRIYAEQRERLQKDYLDFYLLHNLNGARWREMADTGVMDWCLERQAAGEFRHFGFSFHGSYEEFREILTARPWDCCQIQLNYMDTQEQAGMKGYSLTEELGVPLIIMEPVKGGALAALPAEVMEGFAALRPEASASSWALRWAASLPNVMTVLSGLSTMGQVEDNLATLNDFQPLSEAERAAVDRAAALFRKKVRNGCTGCRYCMPCPAGVDIPGVFRLWNDYAMYQNRERARFKWKDMDEEERPQNCVGCGACEEKCPQRLPIRADLARAGEELEKL